MKNLHIFLARKLLIITFVLLAFFIAFAQLRPVFADPLQPSEIKALNYWPNWVAGSCDSDPSAGIGKLVAGSGSPDGTTFPNLSPTVMANAIDTFVKKEQPKSPLNGLGATMVASAKNSNINPFLVVAIAQNETSLGTATTRQVTDANNIFDRAALSNQPHIYISPVVSSQPSLWYKWTSVKASVDYTAPENLNAAGGGDIFSYLRNQYGESLNDGKLETFSGAYDTPSQAAQYAASLKPSIDEMVKDAGSASATPPPAASQPPASCSCTSGGSPTETALVGNDNKQKIFNYFVSKGLTPAQSAGIDGNFGQESGWDPSSPGGYLAQWGGGRLTALEAFAQKENKPVTDLGVQLDYVWLELTGGPGAGEDDSSVLAHIKNANTAADAATIFSNEFERPGDPQLQNRIDYANSILQDYGSSAAGGGVNSPCGGVVNCNGTDAATTGLSPTRQSIVCTAQAELKLWQSKPGYPHPSFAQDGYLKYSQNRTEEWCADFASWVYNQANYPLDSSDWNVAYVPDMQSIGEQNKNFHWHPASSGYTPKPGDLAIHGSSHVNIFVSSSGNTATYIGGDQGDGPYPGGSIVSTETGNGYYDGGITGYVSPD